MNTLIRSALENETIGFRMCYVEAPEQNYAEELIEEIKNEKKEVFSMQE